MASEVGYAEAALEYFVHACAVDLADVHANTADGIHIASCGGTWLALVAGFGGLRETYEDVCFAPRLPADWERLRFRVHVREQLIEVDMTPDATRYRLLEGRGMLIHHFGEPLRLQPNAPVERPREREAVTAGSGADRLP
jgi:alpha,alpha-trehalose phosphorylase